MCLSGLPLTCPLQGTWPATQAYSLTGNGTGDPLICRKALNPLSHTSQGLIILLKSVGSAVKFLLSFKILDLEVLFILTFLQRIFSNYFIFSLYIWKKIIYKWCHSNLSFVIVVFDVLFCLFLFIEEPINNAYKLLYKIYLYLVILFFESALLLFSEYFHVI